MAFCSTIEHDAASMPPRVDKLLADLKAWCDEERGRRSEVARMLGISRAALTQWFNPESSRLPTAEQALAIQEFLQTQRHRRPGPGASESEPGQ
jgi:hypothetical protein